jgi:hypothetical protein
MLQEIVVSREIETESAHEDDQRAERHAAADAARRRVLDAAGDAGAEREVEGAEAVYDVVRRVRHQMRGRFTDRLGLVERRARRQRRDDGSHDGVLRDPSMPPRIRAHDRDRAERVKGTLAERRHRVPTVQVCSSTLSHDALSTV